MASTIEFYGAEWCGDCRRAKQVLDRYHVVYNHHDIESEEGAAERAEQISGQKHIPVLLFEDGPINSRNWALSNSMRCGLPARPCLP